MALEACLVGPRNIGSWADEHRVQENRRFLGAEIFILFGRPLEIVDGEGELETADVVEDDSGAFLAIDQLDGALEAF